MRKQQNMVREFHKKFGHPQKDKPTFISDDKRVTDRAEWTVGEALEFVKAKNLTHQVDAVVDMIYFCLGTLVELGVDAEEVFAIVHENNMKKIPDPNNPKAKPIKPDDWWPAEVLIEQYLKEKLNGVKSQENKDS